MRRKWMMLFGAMGLLIVFNACGENEENADVDLEKEAEDISTEFLETLYNVEDPDVVDESDSPEEMADYLEEMVDKYEPYFTEEELEELVNKRFFSKPDEAASKQDSTIEMKDLELEVDETDEESEWKFDHTFTLVFEDEAGEEIETADVTGQITVIDESGDLKINRYYDEGFPMDMLEPL